MSTFSPERLAKLVKDETASAFEKIQPNALRQQAVNRELMETIRGYLGDKFGKTERRELINDDGQDPVTMSDREIIVIGLALRMTNNEIARMVNDERKKYDRPAITGFSISYYRKKYSDLVDEVYSEIAVRIGEIYTYADKLKRIGRYDELAQLMRQKVVAEFEGAGEPSETALKIANLYIRVLDKLNAEMGGKSLLDGMIQRRGEDNLPDTGLPANDMKEVIQDTLEARYANQLPERSMTKIKWSDYTVCALGEKLGDMVVCWHSGMTQGDPGTQCPIQAGKTQQCPKFINRTILDNRDWLHNVRIKNEMTIREIAVACGCEQADKEVYDRIVHYLHKHDVPYRKRNVDEPSIDTEQDEDGTGESSEGADS